MQSGKRLPQSGAQHIRAYSYGEYATWIHHNLYHLLHLPTPEVLLVIHRVRCREA